jgi:hypothetical protein
MAALGLRPSGISPPPRCGSAVGSWCPVRKWQNSRDREDTQKKERSRPRTLFEHHDGRKHFVWAASPPGLAPSTERQRTSATFCTPPPKQSKQARPGFWVVGGRPDRARARAAGCGLWGGAPPSRNAGPPRKIGGQ